VGRLLEQNDANKKLFRINYREGMETTEKLGRNHSGSGDYLKPIKKKQFYEPTRVGQIKQI